MESSIIQKYNFREHSDGVMIGGFSLRNILTTSDFGNINGASQLEGFSVPVGLYISNSSEMKGGFEKSQAKIILGDTIDEERFQKLYGGVAKCLTKKTSKTLKKK